MRDLPHIAEVDSPNKFYRVVYEENDSLRNDKVLAYLNQTGLVNYNDQKQCENGHNMDLKKNNKTNGWWWRCAPKGCQKTKSVRVGTFFFVDKIQLWQVLVLPEQKRPFTQMNGQPITE